MQPPYDNAKVTAMLNSMAADIRAAELHNPALIGIHTGGARLAARLHMELGIQTELGMLDISFYRDDFSSKGLHPQVKSSHLPFAIDRRDLILVDDVLHTGRTIRAALNEIFSYGRPRRVCLGVLIERPGRELPIQADVVGASLRLANNEAAKLNYKDGELTLNIVQVEGVQ